MWSVCALSLGKARAAVPALAVVAGGPFAGRGAYLARRGRFRDRWRPYGWRPVLYLGRVPCRAFAGRLRALWRGGWCWSVLAPCVALGGPCVAGAGVVLTGGAWPLPPLRCGPLQLPPLRSLVLQSSAPAAVGPWRAVGGVALVADQIDIFKERARLALLALSRCLWWPWRESNPRRRWRSPVVAALALAGRGG